MAEERTFIAVKPDGVQRGLVGEIISRYEKRGFKLIALKALTPSAELAKLHYDEHKERPFFGELVDFLTSGPVVGMVWQGLNVVQVGRSMIGVTKPFESAPGTIRGDFGITVSKNIIHGSDSVDSAQREIALWFTPNELLEWKLTSEQHIY